jgi:hypothetical protein
MGYALIWSEGLAVALLSLALATAWATRGGSARALWVVIVSFAFFAAAAVAVVWTLGVYTWYGNRVRTTWFVYTLSWLAAFTASSVFLFRQGLRRPGPGLARPATAWPSVKLWLGFGGAALALGFTFWNMDLATRADLAIARQEAGALLLALNPPPVAEAENAARVYAEATKGLGETIRSPWIGAPHRANWMDPYVVELVKKHEDSLALLRKAAAMPRCNFGHQRTLLDAVSDHPERVKFLRAATFLAVDARVKAAQGNLPRAFEDISALLGINRHMAGFSLFWVGEGSAWRTLEDVLRLAPPGKEPLPALAIPELVPLVGKIREEQALLGMIMPAAASQPSLVLEQIRRNDGLWAALALNAAIIPARVFLIPDDLVMMHKLIEEYQKSPRSSQDETPKDWADLGQSVATGPTSLYGVIYVRPKHEKLLVDGAALAALRHTARAGLAAAAYHRKHGRYPERLEQLVPEFLPAMPVDPRDGQPLRIRHFNDGAVVYGPQDSAAAEGGNGRIPEGHRPAPIFRLYASTSLKVPE